MSAPHCLFIRLICLRVERHSYRSAGIRRVALHRVSSPILSIVLDRRLVASKAIWLSAVSAISFFYGC